MLQNRNIIFTLILSLIGIISYGQCSFSGLNLTYCIDDPTSELTGDPLGGSFSGPGMTDNIFNPADAGVGVHTIEYTLLAGGTGDKYYIHSTVGEPWGSPANAAAMDSAFGGGMWTPEFFETVDVASVFSPTTGFIFLDGSDDNADELNTFLIANLPAIEAWVFDGGRLLLNAAPNEGADINFGFGGTTCTYPAFVNDVDVQDVAHPAYVGPDLPTTVSMSAFFYAHSQITGPGYTTILAETGIPGNIVLCEKPWGVGTVMMGGMTTHNYHSPLAEATNWRANLFYYLYSLGAEDACTVSQEVEVFALPDVTASVDNEEICQGETVIFNSGGADTYTWDVPGVTSGISYTPIPLGLTTYTVTGINTTSGCENSASVDVIVNEIPTITATASATEVCFGETLTLTGAGADTYVWDNGATNGVAFTPPSLGSMTYTVTGTSAEGCEANASINVNIIDCEPVFAGFTFDDNICVGDCITLTDTSIGSTIQTYEWEFDGAVDPSTSTLQNPTLCFNTVGEFDISLTITSLYGQVSTATHTLSVNELPVVTAGVDTIIDLGGEAELIATSLSDGTWNWTPEKNVDCISCPISLTSPQSSTTYTITLIDENGCKDEDTVMVLVNFKEGVGVPTAFSPNGDGENDILYVKGIGLSNVYLAVYNRFGQLVFETADQRIGWDGTFQGKELNPAVYTWVLSYDFISGKKGKQKGNTTLIR
jgi:gliding motility-associated-like protein